MNDLIKRESAIAALDDEITITGITNAIVVKDYVQRVKHKLEQLPSAQTESLSDAYAKAVWTWMLDYQIKVAELKGRYTPYEVLSWLVNDWRKEHERSDR